MFYQALTAYFEYEQWKPSAAAMPWVGARNQQPYMWVRAIECIRAAHNRARNEEALKEHRMRNAGGG